MREASAEVPAATGAPESANEVTGGAPALARELPAAPAAVGWDLR
jgi:hypothetical protein